MDAAESDRLLDLLTADGEIPIKRHEQSIFLAQGTADTVGFGSATAVTAEQLDARSNDVTYKTYPGVDHNGLMATAKAEILVWSAGRVRH